MLEHVVLPHFTFFGSLSFVIGLALGVSLLFGLLTVLSSIGGALWQCNIASGLPSFRSLSGAMVRPAARQRTGAHGLARHRCWRGNLFSSITEEDPP